MTEAFEQFLGRAGHLRLDVASGAAKPYKPAVLLAAILLTQKLRPQDNLGQGHFARRPKTTVDHCPDSTSAC